MLKQIMRNIENGYTDYDDWSDDYEIIIDNIDTYKDKLKLWKYAQEQALKKKPKREFNFNLQTIKCFLGFHLWEEDMHTRTCIACGRMEHWMPKAPDGIGGHWEYLD